MRLRLFHSGFTRHGRRRRRIITCCTHPATWSVLPSSDTNNKWSVLPSSEVSQPHASTHRTSMPGISVSTLVIYSIFGCRFLNSHLHLPISSPSSIAAILSTHLPVVTINDTTHATTIVYTALYGGKTSRKEVQYGVQARQLSCQSHPSCHCCLQYTDAN